MEVHRRFVVSARYGGVYSEIHRFHPLQEAGSRRFPESKVGNGLDKRAIIIWHVNHLDFALTKTKPSGVCQEEQPYIHRFPPSGEQSNSCQTICSFAASACDGTTGHGSSRNIIGRESGKTWG